MHNPLASFAAALGKRLLLWLLCIVVGAVYGGVSGAIAGGVMLASGDPGSQPPASPILGFGLLGVGLGGIGGCITGFLAALFRRRMGWVVAVTLGLVPGAVLVSYASLSPEYRLAGIAAGLFGLFVCLGLLGARTGLPGIRTVARFADDTLPRPRRAQSSHVPDEPIPASAPQARGDETSPAP